MPKEKLSLRKRRIICLSVIAVCLGLFLIALLTPIASIQPLANILLIVPLLCMGVDVTWFAMTFRCPKCGRRLPATTLFPLIRCPHCGEKLPDLSIFQDE